MQNINVIVAMCKNKGIGFNNKLPWGYISKDLLNFKKLTIGKGNNAIIMGKNTLLSLPNGPLKSRTNLILSKTINDDEIIEWKKKYFDKNIEFFNNLNKLDDYLKNNIFDDIWIIGGEQIYNLYVRSKIVKKIYITYIDHEYKCDTFFPDIKFHNFISKTLSYNTIDENNNSINVYDIIYEL